METLLGVVGGALALLTLLLQAFLREKSPKQKALEALEQSEAALRALHKGNVDEVRNYLRRRIVELRAKKPK